MLCLPPCLKLSVAACHHHLLLLLYLPLLYLPYRNFKKQLGTSFNLSCYQPWCLKTNGVLVLPVSNSRLLHIIIIICFFFSTYPSAESNSSLDHLLFPGTYFNCIMMMVASSVVLTVVVLNYHHRLNHTLKNLVKY